jgi:hypothetical protein
VRPLRFALPLLLLAASPAAAQEAPLPAGAAARVGAEIVPRSDFDAWYRPAARDAKVDPPRFDRCIAALAKRTAKRTPRPSRHQLRSRCERRAQNVRAEVMQFLLQSVWVRQEAAARGIVVTLPQVVRSFERHKREAFESEREYRRFLRTSAFTEAQIIFRVALSMLQERITEQVAAGVREVTEDDVNRYYAEHRRKYRGVPRRRALRVIDRLLTARRQMRAIDRFVTDFRARYRSITVCAEGYVVSECSERAPGSTRSASRG